MGHIITRSIIHVNIPLSDQCPNLHPHLKHDRFRNLVEFQCLTSFPVQTLDLVGQNHAFGFSPRIQLDLEWITFDLRGNGAK